LVLELALTLLAHATAETRGAVARLAALPDVRRVVETLARHESPAERAKLARADEAARRYLTLSLAGAPRYIELYAPNVLVQRHMARALGAGTPSEGAGTDAALERLLPADVRDTLLALHPPL